MTRTVYLAWQDPATRQWFPVGRLTKDEREEYVFVYLQGAQEAQQRAGFSGLAAFPAMDREYHSKTLFPLFSNRLLRPSRPDYEEFLEWLSLDQVSAQPLAVLARSGGQRVTDTLEVFAGPEKLSDGRYESWFFVHGLRYMTEEARNRALQLTPGQKLMLMWDFQNPHDSGALCLRTAETTKGDLHVIGYCPRYLRQEILSTLTAGDQSAEVTVQRVNPPPAPEQFRVLCRLAMRWVHQPLSGPEFRPLIDLGGDAGTKQVA
ncbi:MAG: DNA-binding protein [Bryobacterales bacterium]|nr:DNA-binding protein [Bryobacterales bacterium]